MLSDLDLPALREYRSAHRDPQDFEAFWKSTLDQARTHAITVRLTPVATRLETTEVFDITWAGYDGERVHGWLRLPTHRTGPLPAVVQYHGYASGRGAPTDDLLWSAAGYAHLVMDVRGQGGAWAGGGATADPHGTGSSHPGFLTRGIEAPGTYYYRRAYTDAVRAVDAVRALPRTDPGRVAVIGNSQGAGIALAVAGLVPDVAALHAQAPFLTDIRRAVRVTGTAPYREITGYLAAHRDRVEQVFATLAYFDGVAFARRATAPAWFSTGLTDDVVPPSAVFGAYHAYTGPKHIDAWEFNGHEAGGAEDTRIALDAFYGLLQAS